MSYHLIGNISALICDDGIEPLATATLRIYLPAMAAGGPLPAFGISQEPMRIQPEEAASKADRLLAEVTLDAEGNFRACWQEIHLFTEPLEIDMCITHVPGVKKAAATPQHFHLGVMVPNWRRNKDRYLSAFAYIIPSDCWNSIRHQLQSWAITGVVKHYRSHNAMPKVRVQAYNARNGKKLGEAMSNEYGRFRMQFPFEPAHRHLLPVRNGVIRIGPDVFFKVLTPEGFIIWSEERSMGSHPQRQGVPPCSKQDLYIKPSPILKSMIHLSGWRQLVQIARMRKRYFEHYSLV